MKTEQKPNDIIDRDTARFTFDGNIIVKAGAGTGKTTLLIDRLCYLILGKKAGNENFSVENILALTFTRKAAAEIKARLAYKLATIIKMVTGGRNEDKNISSIVENLKTKFGQKPQNIAQNANKALFLLDRSQIGTTIHGFASSVLKSFALDAGVDPSFEEDEGRKFDEIFRREFARWLETELDDNCPHKEKWKFVLKNIELEDIKIFTRKLCGSKLENRKMENPADFLHSYKEKLAEIKKLNEKYLQITKSKKTKNSLISTEESLACLVKAIENNDFQKMVLPDIPFPAGLISGWSREDFNKAKSLFKFARNANVFNQKIVSDVFSLVKPFVNIFTSVYDREGFVSFDGLLIKARNLVRDNRHARDRLKEKYQYILIDEFQDTDPLQGEIIIFLAEKSGDFASDWQNVKLSQGKLFIVGDDKQSIYRFRGADIRAYDKFTALLEHQKAVKCFLQTNFRSHQSLTETVNFLVSKVMKKSDKQCTYVPIFAERKTQIANGAELVLTDTSQNAKADDFRTLQASFIADWIRCNVGKPLFEGAENLRFRDIAVLFRSMNGLNIYLEALKQKKINYSVEEDRYFYFAQEIVDLVNLLKVLINPQDKISLVGVLRSALGGFTDSEIYKFQKSGLLDYKTNRLSDFENLKKFYFKLSKLNNILGRTRKSDFMNILLKEMHVFEILSAAYNGEQTIANIFKFISVINGLDRLSFEKLEQLLNPSPDFASSAREGESSLVDETLDAVNIMTVHKAKGLEFSVVIVADINCESKPLYVKNEFIYDWYGNKTGFGISNFKDIALNILREDEAKHSLAEEVRVFYVALTRAKDKFILVGNKKPPRNNTIAGYINKSLAFENTTLGSCDFALKVTLYEGKKTNYLPYKKNKNLVSDAKKWSLSRNEKISEFKKFYRQEIFTSPTLLREKTSYEFSKDNDLHSREGAILGTLCHKILEFHDFKGKFDLGEIKTTLYPLIADYEGELDFDGLSKKAYEILTNFTSSKSYELIASSHIMARELPFDYVYRKNGDTFVMRGIIDLLTKNDGKLYVMDYKSEFILPGEEVLCSQKFTHQCEIYRKFISKSFPNLPIYSKVIFLVTGKSVEV